MNLHIVFGIGDCKRIKQIVDDGSSVFVYEPYRDNFDKYKGLLPKSKKVFVLVEYGGDMTDLMLSMFEAERPKYIYCETLDKYSDAYPGELLDFQNSFDEAIKIYQTNEKTKKRFEKNIAENEKSNKTAIACGKSFKSIPKKGNVAYVIAAGSSLDKNIAELKNVKGMIIATDTAINPLLANGIMPDLAVSIDAGKSPLHFANRKSWKIPLICRTYTNKDIIKIHKGRKYFVGDEILTGGSVTTDAISVAENLGYKTIVFVGLDLAYTNDISYAKDTVNYGKSVNDGFEICKGIDGKDIPTTLNLNIYRKWIERFIKGRPGIRFVDCTEGGALIDGSEVMSLAEFVKGEC